ncbi:hypothetical protein D910_09106, partial [Dendroctonus ponderosae]
MMYFHPRITVLSSSKQLFSCPLRLKSSFKHIDKLLIANRGEIACRIIRTAKRLGIRTVAVYSEADKNSLHVALASEAYEIGPPPASQSYLKGQKLLDVARKANCQAIHPGYGFLSENVEFAEACHKENVIFIGPPAKAIRDMGIKSTSKHIMSKAGVPIIEGYHGEDQIVGSLKRQAQRIGFPVMIKAVRGGGGKGMRVANTEEDFEEALESARTESQKAFADSVVLLEKFVAEPRHVEVQVFADTHGNAVYLYERDCSVQRRHQKIIEEAPAPGLTGDLRKELGTAAVRAAKAVGYVGAGTVEFILDRTSLNFHFMEMNTRLQVEHPITEMITGKNLEITSVRQGDEVSVYYDPMIAKLVVWGQDRREALNKLNAKLLDYNIAGMETNVNFLLKLANHPEFQAGNVHTNFIKDQSDSLFEEDALANEDLIQAALSMVILDRNSEEDKARKLNDAYNPFVVEPNFRVNYEHLRNIKLRFRDQDHTVKVKFPNSRSYEVSCDNGATWCKAEASLKKIGNKTLINCSINGHKTTANVFRSNEILAVFSEKGKVQYELSTPSYHLDEDSGSSLGSAQKAVSPMPGVLDKVLVNVGDVVKKGDSLFVLIAMKMEHIVKATGDAKVASIHFKVGQSVLKDATVVKFEDPEESTS